MIDDFKKPTTKKPPLPETPPEPQPDFVPPEKVEATEVEPDSKGSDTITSPMSNNTKHKRGLKKLSKRQKLILAGVAGVLLLAIGSYFVFFKPDKKPAPAPPPVAKQVEPPKPTTEASKLTGVQVSPEINATPTTGVMIENSPDARPQSGLTTAGVVYEAIAEGGITRFLAIFEGTVPDYIGPIRSARPYYLDWILAYDAGLAHAGGSPDALAYIRAKGIKDLDQFANSGSYTRVSSRYAPHNLYSGVDRLVALQKQKGYGTSKFLGFARKGEKPAVTPTAVSIDESISGFLYNPHWDYDKTTNTYKRSEAGKPHIDLKTGAQIAPKVLVVMVLPQGLASDRLHTTYGTIGSGKAFIFQDGTVTEGIWEKKDPASQIRLGDANGAPIAVNTGQTWISVVGSAGAVKYKP